MSRHYSSVATLVFLVAIGLAANYAEEHDSSRDSAARSPNALAGKKEAQANGGEAALFRHTEKLQGPLQAELTLAGPAPERAGDTFVVKAAITSEKSLNDVEFKWSLPAELELVNGQLKGHIGNVGQDKPAETQLTVKTLTGENHQVHLIVSAVSHGARFARSVQYNTLIEPLLAESRRELKKTVKESARDSASEGKSKLKVFH